MYEWDEAKRPTNIVKHHVDFAAMTDFAWDTAVTRASPRRGEQRWMAKGFIGDILHSVVYTLRGGRVRVISLRRATGKEMVEYVDGQA